MIFSSDSESDLEVLVDLAQLSDWDSSEEESRRPRKIKRVNYMQSLDDAEFTFTFRLSKSAVESLLKEVMPWVLVNSSRNNGVPPLHQLLITLRFYAIGTMLVSAADYFGISVSTAGRIVRNISSAIARLYDKYIYVHKEGTENFYKIAGFPQVLATIDCTHIRIQCPTKATIKDNEFKNNKGYFSINVQAACDADFKFMNVVAHWPGSTDDITIFNNSILKVQCETGQFGNRWLLGDNAYPNRPYLLTPVISPVTIPEQRYNDAHIQTHHTIERTFAMWKQRFPVVAQTFRLSLPVIQTVIISTAVLHNICKIHNLEELASEVDLSPADEDDEDDEDICQSMEVEDVRERDKLIANYFCS